jgi:hypothetical protein
VSVAGRVVYLVTGQRAERLVSGPGS